MRYAKMQQDRNVQREINICRKQERKKYHCHEFLKNVFIYKE